MDTESSRLIPNDINNDQNDYQNDYPSRCNICCLMCSCRNRRGFWYTKLGKFIFWLPLFIILFGVGLILLDMIGIVTMKIVYDQYDIKTGCLYESTINNCTNKPLCYINDRHSLILGCAAIGSISFVILFISILLIMIFIGLIFYCTDSCCGEINKSYKQSQFTLQRQRYRENALL